jgi:hypothetical protein
MSRQQHRILVINGTFEQFTQLMERNSAVVMVFQPGAGGKISI